MATAAGSASTAYKRSSPVRHSMCVRGGHDHLLRKSARKVPPESLQVGAEVRVSLRAAWTGAAWHERVDSVTVLVRANNLVARPPRLGEGKLVGVQQFW